MAGKISEELMRVAESLGDPAPELVKRMRAFMELAEGSELTLFKLGYAQDSGKHLRDQVELKEKQAWIKKVATKLIVEQPEGQKTAQIEAEASLRMIMDWAITARPELPSADSEKDIYKDVQGLVEKLQGEFNAFYHFDYPRHLIVVDTIMKQMHKNIAKGCFGTGDVVETRKYHPKDKSSARGGGGGAVEYRSLTLDNSSGMLTAPNTEVRSLVDANASMPEVLKYAERVCMTPSLVGILLECPEGVDPCGCGKIGETFYYVSLNEAKCLYRELEVVSRDMTPKAFLDYTNEVFRSVAALMGGEGGQRVSAAAAMNKQGHLVRQTFSSALAVSGIHVQAFNVGSPFKRPRVQPNSPGPGGDGSPKPPTIERMMGGNPASKFPCQRDACGAESMCNRSHG